MNKPLQNKKILVVDDDVALADLVTMVLTKAGAKIFSASDGQRGLREFLEHQPDLVFLDVMMPGMNGLELCAQLNSLANTPIIMLTALDQEAEIIKGLECGATDYITKPFYPQVLVAKVEAILRRSKPKNVDQNSPIYVDDYLLIDLHHRRVTVNGQTVSLSATEFNLLAYLLKNANQVVTSQQILNNVWGWDNRDRVDNVPVYISRLRRKLEKDSRDPQYLLTEQGVGYRFETLIV